MLMSCHCRCHGLGSSRWESRRDSGISTSISISTSSGSGTSTDNKTKHSNLGTGSGRGHGHQLQPAARFVAAAAMEVFGAAVTVSVLVLRFVTACAASSNDAASLEARFNWDFWGTAANRSPWVLHKTKLKALEAELFVFKICIYQQPSLASCSSASR